MPATPETIAYCHACGAPMDVTSVAPFSNVECPQCGKHTRVKREFGPYTLVRRHAVGGMSMVFAAHDNTLDREVALKILSEEYSADERRIAAFEEEARLTASFSHPNVVRVLTTGRAFGRFFIAMELVPGGHFEHQIRERGRIPEVELLPLAIEVAQGLKAAHAAGLIHRDVKPGNILLDAEGHAKLVDFGLALVTHGGKAQAKELWATPYYVPPETVEGHAEDFRSDIYAFGATLYHALAGQPPCGEESMATDVLREAKKRVVPLGKVEPSVSAETCRIVDKAMAYDARARFSSYDEMFSSLAVALSHLKSGRSESNGSIAKRRAEKKRRETVLLLAGAASLVIVVGGLVWWLGRGPSAKPGDVRVPAVPVAPPVAKDTSAAIASSYREARSALESKNYSKAVNEFTVLFANPDVQEPTRTWAGVEAVLAAFLDGHPADGRRQGRQVADHVRSLPPGSARIDGGLLGTLDKLGGFEPIGLTGTAQGGASLVISAMLAGLKNWEQGLLEPAASNFRMVASAKLPPDDGWASIYQTLARDYLADHAVLIGPLFSGLPDDRDSCEKAAGELNMVFSSMKTRGRAPFNVRAWQLDLTRHAELLGQSGSGTHTKAPAQEDPPEPAPPALGDVIARLEALARDYQFTEAGVYLKSLAAGSRVGGRDALLVLVQSAAAFLADLEEDLAKGPVVIDLQFKTGETAGRIAAAADGSLTVTGANGVAKSCQWSDFAADSLIALHTQLVRNPKSELERLRRHECAIAFDWLAGNRERALRAAGVLSQTSPTFKQRWDSISAGLPR